MSKTQIPTVIPPKATRSRATRNPSHTSAQCEVLANWGCKMLGLPDERASVLIGRNRRDAEHTERLLKAILFAGGHHQPLANLKRELEEAGKVADQPRRQQAAPPAPKAEPLSEEQVTRLVELEELKAGGERLDGDPWQELLTLRAAKRVADGKSKGRSRSRSRKGSRPAPAAATPAETPVVEASPDAVVSHAVPATKATAASPA